MFVLQTYWEKIFRDYWVTVDAIYSYILGKPRHLVYKRRFNRNVDQSMSTRRKSASNLGMPGDDRLSQIAEKFSMDMFQMQRAASREDRQTDSRTDSDWMPRV